MKNIVLKLVAVLSLVVLFTSCSSDDKSKKVVNINSPIVQKWKLDNRSVNASSETPMLINIAFKVREDINVENLYLTVFGEYFDLFQIEETCEDYLSQVVKTIFKSIAFRKDGIVTVLYNDDSLFERYRKYATYSLLSSSQLALNIDTDVLIKEASIDREEVKEVLAKVFAKDLIVNYQIETDKLRLSFDLDFLAPKFREIYALLNQYPDQTLIIEPEIHSILDQLNILIDKLESFEINLQLKV